MPSTEVAGEVDQLGVVSVVSLVFVEKMPQGVPMRGAIREGATNVGIAILFDPARRNGVGTVASIWSPADARPGQVRLRSGTVKRNAMRRSFHTIRRAALTISSGVTSLRMPI